MARRISFGNYFLFLALNLTVVSSWTIDLPEIRKYVFERNDYYNKKHDVNDIKDNYVKDQYYYSNREGNSLHNTKHYEDVYENNPYAKGYGYQSYMEKKVHNIVYKGSYYLEGLQRALNNYTKFLESCNKMNMSFSTNSTWRPSFESKDTRSRANFTMKSCETATKASEHVRRLSELALWTTRELQDIAYSRKYKKGDVNELTMEENELILKLAWFLDRLAHYTGYEPNVHDFLHQDERPSTTPPSAPMPLSLMNAPDDVKIRMMECLKEKSDVPATVRCAYPLPMPDLAKLMQNYSDEFASQMLERFTNRQQTPSSEQVELLVASESFPPNLTPVTTVKRQKRANPTVNLFNHFTKTKVWLNDNTENLSKNHGNYEVKNNLPHSIHKRSIDVINKKFKHFLPADPFQDLSKYVKHRAGVNYIKDEEQAAKIKEYIDKLHKKDSSNLSLNKIVQKFRPKRSVKFERVDLPRESVDPQKDISYYVKNKDGTEFNPNPVQALQVIAGLEQVFQTGNIEVIRRYGANYNPLVPDPFILAVIKSGADNI